MYRTHARLLSIYVMTADGLSPTGRTRVERVGRTLIVMREGHLSQVSWIEDGLIYSVVGELSEPALLAALEDLSLGLWGASHRRPVIHRGSTRPTHGHHKESIVGRNLPIAVFEPSVTHQKIE